MKRTGTEPLVAPGGGLHLCAREHMVGWRLRLGTGLQGLQVPLGFCGLAASGRPSTEAEIKYCCLLPLLALTLIPVPCTSEHLQ